MDVARRLGVGRSSVYAMLSKGKLHAIKIGHLTRIHATEVERIINSMPAAVYRGRREAA
jgi:excisionase family DNA binding protein